MLQKLLVADCIDIQNINEHDFLLHWYSWAWLWWGFDCPCLFK